MIKTREESFAALQGLFNIMVTPFGPNGSLNDVALAESVQRIFMHGYDGVLIGGTYGEFATMTPRERAELFRAAERAADNRLPLLLCVAHSDPRIVRELTELASSLGGIPMVTPPFVSEVTDEQIEVFFREICKLSSIGLVIYNAPGVGITLSPSLIERLAAIPGIIGLKQGDLAPGVVDQLVSRLSGKLRLFCASDLQMPGPAVVGFDGLSSTNSCALPELIRQNYEAFRAGDARRGAELYRGWYRYREFARAAGQPQTVKAAMQIRGWNVGSVRLPLLDLSPSEFAELEEILIEITSLGASV